MTDVEIYLALKIQKHYNPNVSMKFLRGLLEAYVGYTLGQVPIVREHHVTQILNEQPSRKSTVKWLYAHGYKQDFIAELLGISQQAVSYNASDRNSVYKVKVGYRSGTLSAIRSEYIARDLSVYLNR